jgi:arylsulfatase A-like enzyme
VATGFVLGIATGLLVAAVDATRGLVGAYGGSRTLHALCIFGLLVPALSLAGALTGALFGRALRLGAGDGFAAGSVRSSVAALPFVAFFVWVPSGWLRDHWATLPGKHRALGVLALLAIAAGVLAGARLLYALWRRRAAGGFGTLGMAGSLALCVLLATATGWADAVLYEGDYEDFHYGLAGTFVGAVALGTAIVAGLLPARRALRPGRRTLSGVAAALTASFLLVLFAPASAFSKSSALVFSKLVGTGRSLTDFDGDGYAGVLGGSDCAQLDAHVSPGGLEVPENGRDDDCSGKDAPWPPAPRPVPKRATAARPNVVLISIDALRADHLGAYGYRRATSPSIDRLAARSLLFTDAYAQAPKTTDSVPSIMTGAYPSNIPRDYTNAKRREDGGYELSEDARPLAVLFKASGYATAAGTGFRLDQVARGFETFETGHPTQTALRFLETTNVPFFLWLHYAEPHIPYARHKEHDFGASPVDRYDGEIAAADAQVGKVLRALEEHELTKTTIVIVTADHGEEFLEHGGTSHTRKLYRELLHVPLIVQVPGTQARRVKGPVELVDIVPTLAELTGIELADGAFDGESLLADERPKDAVAYAEDLRAKTGEIAKRALFNGRYRLIDDRVNDRIELYDDKKDPREQRELALKRPDLVARLREALSVHALRRHTEPMKRLSDRADAATWAALLPAFRRPEVLGAALDRFPKARSPERDAVLEKLLARRNLDAGIAARARALSGR